MIWHEMCKERPPYGELIWVWDNDKKEKFLIRYLGSEETWEKVKYDSNCPIWAYLNDDEEK